MNAPSLAPAPLNLIVPQNVRYDGVQESPVEPLLQFTDQLPGPSFGATFYLRVREATSITLARKTARVRRSFRTPTEPLAPVFQQQPRLFLAPDRHHY